jgi:hypothetical protein
MMGVKLEFRQRGQAASWVMALALLVAEVVLVGVIHLRQPNRLSGQMVGVINREPITLGHFQDEVRL